MESSINILKTRRDEIMQLLKTETNKSLLLSLKKDLDRAIRWLETISELQWENPTRYNIVELPDMNTGYAEYRIMNDCETDNQEHWIEFEIEVHPTPGDYLVISKPR